MRIVNLFRYPVKGLSAEAMGEVVLEAGFGFPLDRKYAVTDGSLQFDPAAPKPAPKTQFLMLAKHENLARLKSRLIEADNRLELRNGADVRTFALDDAAERSALARLLAGVVDVPLPGEPEVVHAPGHQFTDVSVHSVALMRSISLINLTTVGDLSAHLALPLDPIRFRANLYFEGPAAWSELDWVGRRLGIGEVALKVVRRTKRCAATSVDPDRAVRDINLPIAIRDYQGHGDLGIYAEVEAGGRIAAGDRIELLD
ncbi:MULTISPECIES: MOSC domain-containing protein [Xanthobacter]|uniref:MOSC domain-containing protein n=1 Tax=Xanthobacter TaxID=279 RepID=UPI0035B481C2